jgi:anti-sigma-K factor RskA
MGETDHNQVIEQIPAYALGALDAEDAAVVRRHLPGCASCQSELAAYESVVDAMSLAAPDATPPSVSKNRLMERIAVSPDRSTAAAEAGPSLGQRISAALRSLSAAPRWQPAALILIIVLIASNLLLWQQAAQPGDNTAGWHRFRLAGSELTPQASGIIYVSADGRNGTLIVDGLPELDPTQQYQLWLIKDGERTSGAVFSVSVDGYRGLEIESDEPLLEYSSFGVTIEPAGGSPGPTGDRVLGYNL